jgi:hypothetical protein
VNKRCYASKVHHFGSARGKHVCHLPKGHKGPHICGLCSQTPFCIIVKWENKTGRRKTLRDYGFEVVPGSNDVVQIGRQGVG